MALLTGLLMVAALACSSGRSTSTPETTATPAAGVTPSPSPSPVGDAADSTVTPSPTSEPTSTTAPGATPSQSPEPTATLPPTSTPGVASTPTVPPTSTPSPEPEEGQDPADGEIKEPRALIYELFSRDLAEVMADMRGSGNPEYIPILVEIMRFPLNPVTIDYLGTTLSILSGQEGQVDAGDELDWFWWLEWMGNHPEVVPPEGYSGWKGRLYSAFDPRIGDFFYDDIKSNIRLDEIAWGGVRKDGIPDLTNPPNISAAKASYLSTSDRVFGISINGEHRAYPLRIVNPHELANDELGGVPIALVN